MLPARKDRGAGCARRNRPAALRFPAAELSAAVADLEPRHLPKYAPGPHFNALSAGTVHRLAGGDVVSSAPELARLTMNLATIHHDGRAAGQRLVYGGHTIGLAAAQLTRVLPAMVTILAGTTATTWDRCTRATPCTPKFTVERCEPLPDGGGLVHLRSLVRATNMDGTVSDVLDWRLIGCSRERRHPLRPQHRRRLRLRGRAARRHDTRATGCRRHPLRPDRWRPRPRRWPVTENGQAFSGPA